MQLASCLVPIRNIIYFNCGNWKGQPVKIAVISDGFTGGYTNHTPNILHRTFGFLILSPRELTNIWRETFTDKKIIFFTTAVKLSGTVARLLIFKFKYLSVDRSCNFSSRIIARKTECKMSSIVTRKNTTNVDVSQGYRTYEHYLAKIKTK